MESSKEQPKERKMYLHAELQLAQFHDRQRELIAEADQHRLLVAARRYRRQLTATPDTDATAGQRTDATLGQCGPRAAAPAR
jgi:hypothetical protein